MMVIWNLKDTALINEREGFDGGRTFISGNKEGGGETIWDLDSGDEDECGGDDDNDQPEETVFF